MRNVIALSNMPEDLHNWLKKEAARRSTVTGKRVAFCHLVVQAVREYKTRVENGSGKINRLSSQSRTEIFRKKLRPAEVRRQCVCVPTDKQFFFGKVGNIIVMIDAADGSACPVKVGTQYRLGMHPWFSHHDKVEPGDEIIFEQLNGTISIKEN